VRVLLTTLALVLVAADACHRYRVLRVVLELQQAPRALQQLLLRPGHLLLRRHLLRAC
jgi:hypothetical protein